jgi:hypothetical protein
MQSVVDFLLSEAGVEAIQKNIDEAGRRGGGARGGRSSSKGGGRGGWTKAARDKAAAARKAHKKPKKASSKKPKTLSKPDGLSPGKSPKDRFTRAIGHSMHARKAHREGGTDHRGKIDKHNYALAMLHKFREEPGSKSYHAKIDKMMKYHHQAINNTNSQTILYPITTPHKQNLHKTQNIHKITKYTQ